MPNWAINLLIGLGVFVLAYFAPWMFFEAWRFWQRFSGSYNQKIVYLRNIINPVQVWRRICSLFVSSRSPKEETTKSDVVVVKKEAIPWSNDYYCEDHKNLNLPTYNTDHRSSYVVIQIEDPSAEGSITNNNKSEMESSEDADSVSF